MVHGHVAVDVGGEGEDNFLDFRIRHEAVSKLGRADRFRRHALGRIQNSAENVIEAMILFRRFDCCDIARLGDDAQRFAVAARVLAEIANVALGVSETTAALPDLIQMQNRPGEIPPLFRGEAEQAVDMAQGGFGSHARQASELGHECLDGFGKLPHNPSFLSASMPPISFIFAPICF